MDQLSDDDKMFCSEEFCLAGRPCSYLSKIKDVGIKLGSLNDTKEFRKKQEHNSDTKAKIEFEHGYRQTEIHNAFPMFFKIPADTYLVSGDQFNFGADTCFFTITGYIPDKERTAVLGQTFISNYLTVLDQDYMKIGLGAHRGVDAKISASRFPDFLFMQIIVMVIILLIVFACIIMIGTYIGQKICRPKDDDEDNIARPFKPNEQVEDGIIMEDEEEELDQETP